MRPLLLSALIVSISISPTQAQEFLPIVKEGAVWHQWAGWGAAGDPFSGGANWTNKFLGDTLIDQSWYKKLMVESSKTWMEGYHGAFREDSGRVYYRPVYDSISEETYWCLHMPGWWSDSLDMSADVLLYDLNLNVGDWYYVYEVIAVDTLILADGMSRKRILLEVDSIHTNGALWQDHISWIEGIGSTQGLIEGGCLIFENEYQLNCYIDSSINYPDPCLNYSIWESENEVDWSLTPNPATTSVKIEIPNSERSELVIHNMVGEAVLRRRVSGDQQVDVIGLPPGLYSASLMQNGRSAGSQRMLIIN